MLNLHSLVHDLNKLCTTLDSVYDINSGGCCYVAYLIAKGLDRLGISYNLIMIDCCKRSTEWVEHEVISRRQSKNNLSVTGHNCCNHYYLKIDGIGCINQSDFDVTYPISLKNIPPKNIKWIYDNGDWNECYDTKNNRIIKSLIMTFFKQYEKNNNRKNS